MKTFNEHADKPKCKPFSAHDWETIQYTPRHVMMCKKCNTRMTLQRINQQNSMLSQKKLIDAIRKRED